MLYIRSLIFNIICYSTLAVGCLLTSIIGIFNRKITIVMWNYIILPFLLVMLKYIAGIEIEIRGKQFIRQDGVLYAGKHESALETYFLSAYIKKLVFVLKKELTYVPLFGWAQYFYGMIPVDRSAGGAAMKNLLKQAKDRISKGRPIIIFPEGTRSKDGRIHEFKAGSFKMASRVGGIIVPVVFKGTRTLFEDGYSLLRRPVYIQFLPHINTEGMSEEELHALPEKVQNMIQEAYDRLPPIKGLRVKAHEAEA